MSKFFTTKSLAVLCALVLTGAVAQADTVTVTGPDDAVSDDYTPRSCCQRIDRQRNNL